MCVAIEDYFHFFFSLGPVLHGGYNIYYEIIISLLALFMVYLKDSEQPFIAGNPVF